MSQTATLPVAASQENRRNASPADSAHAAVAASQFISFAIGDDQYGVDIMAVREIKGWSGITQLPKQPNYVRGVLNLRGVTIPIIDLRCRFGQGLTEATPLHVVIIVQIAAQQVGLLADRVLDIVSLEASQVQPVPHTAQGAGADFLSGLATIENTMIALLDLNHLLTGQDSQDDGRAKDEAKFGASVQSN